MQAILQSAQRRQVMMVGWGGRFGFLAVTQSDQGGASLSQVGGSNQDVQVAHGSQPDLRVNCVSQGGAFEGQGADALLFQLGQQFGQGSGADFVGSRVLEVSAHQFAFDRRGQADPRGGEVMVKQWGEVVRLC